MTERITLTIVNKRGLHARASASLLRCAEQFISDITVTKGDMTVSARSIMGLMLLGAHTGTQIEVEATGDDEILAINALQTLVNAGFYED